MIPEIVLQYQINLTLFSHEIKRMFHIVMLASCEDSPSEERPQGNGVYKKIPPKLTSGGYLYLQSTMLLSAQRNDGAVSHQ